MNFAFTSLASSFGHSPMSSFNWKDAYCRLFKLKPNAARGETDQDFIEEELQ